MRLICLTLAATVVALVSFAAQAETEKFLAKLDSASEVPPKSGQGTGTLDATLDTATKITYSDLSGPATMAHFHGPPAPGANAPIAVSFKDPASGAKGSAVLTASQAADLQPGKMSVNVQTAANPGGEIRGRSPRTCSRRLPSVCVA